MDSQVFTNEAAEHHDGQRAKQPITEPMLARGSLPAIMGTKKMPAARKEVATQKMASWRCQFGPD